MSRLSPSLSALALALAVAPAVAPAQAQTREPVLLRVNITTGYGYTPLLKALDVQAPGVRVEYINSATGGVDADAAVAAGRLDISDVGDVTPVFNTSAGGTNVIVACTYPNPDNIKFLVRKDSGIEKVSDLKGKKIGMYIQSNHGLLYQRLLARNGWSASDVQAINISGPDATSALRTKRIDVRSVNVPDAYNVVETFPEIKILEGSSEGVVSGRYCLQTGVRTLREKKEAIAAYLKAAQAAVQWAIANPDEAGRRIQTVSTGYSPKALADTIRISGKGFQPFDAAFYKEVQDFAEELKSIGFVKNSVNVRQIFLADFNDAVTLGK